MMTNSRWTTALWLVLALPSCVREHESELGDSSTHWLKRCAADAECGGLSCRCGVCSRDCSEVAQCSALDARAMCTEGVGARCGSAGTGSTRLCDVMCERDTDCPARAASCVEGRCREATSSLSLEDRCLPQECPVPTGAFSVQPSTSVEPNLCFVPDIPCQSNEFCQIGDDVRCGEDPLDGIGRCEPRPLTCPASYEPVCGCDRRSYGNVCQAHGAGTVVLHGGLCTVDECEGEGGRVLSGSAETECGAGDSLWHVGGGAESALCCRPENTGPRSCGGRAELTCRRGEFCNYEEAEAVGCRSSSEDEGTCTVTPTGCSLIYAPVCGCDHRTYGGSRCDAYAQGVSVLHTGSCTSADCEALGGYTIAAVADAEPVCPNGERAYGGYDVRSTLFDLDGGITVDAGDVIVGPLFESKWCCVP